MMDSLIALAAGSLKALVLLVTAAGVTTALRSSQARLRVVIWSTALAGSLVIPLVTPIVPRLALPLPEGIARFDLAPSALQAATFSTFSPTASIDVGPSVSSATPAVAPGGGRSASTRPRWLIVVWALGATAVLSHLGAGLWRMQRTVRRAHVVGNLEWQADLAWACERVGCRRLVRLVWSPSVDIPATVGVLRPTLLLPPAALSWDRERREAVLLHELIHVSRLDWPLRIVARMARCVYWFNPLAWWAVRRLDLEQELACDEEVVALGTKPSIYACHLLGIARAIGRTPIPAAHGLHFIRRSHLEERIVTILKKTHHRRAGLAVLAPAAVLVAALVPALAAVAPADPVPASPELKQILTQMEAAEARIEPQIERLREVELEMATHLEALEDIEIEFDEEALAALEEKMKPHLERLEEIERDMLPHTARLVEIEERLQNLELHIDDGTLEDIERQLQEQLESFHAQMESIHIDLEPLHEQMEAISQELEPLHQKLAEIHVEIQPRHEELERLHESMVPFNGRMEELHREMEPFHEEMERLGDQLETALRSEVAQQLRSHLAGVTGPNSPFTEAAARVLEAANTHIENDSIRISAPPAESRQILVDLFSPHRVGTQSNFDSAIETAVSSLAPLVISVE